MKDTNNFYVTRDQAKHICDKNQYGEASFLEIIKLNIRFLFCKVTRRYVRRNVKLTKIIKKSNVQTIPLSKKEQLKAEILKKMN